MKHIITLSLLLCLASCAKENDPVGQGDRKAYTVKYFVHNDWTQTPPDVHCTITYTDSSGEQESVSGVTLYGNIGQWTKNVTAYSGDRLTFVVQSFDNKGVRFSGSIRLLNHNGEAEYNATGHIYAQGISPTLVIKYLLP